MKIRNNTVFSTDWTATISAEAFYKISTAREIPGNGETSEEPEQDKSTKRILVIKNMRLFRHCVRWRTFLCFPLLTSLRAKEVGCMFLVALGRGSCICIYKGRNVYEKKS